MLRFELPELPYAKNSLAPFLSEETLDYHHGKHHRAYIDKLNDLIKTIDLPADANLEYFIRHHNGPVFNNAAQAFNHEFYWQCLTPELDTKPSERLMKQIEHAFGSWDAFKTQWTEAASGVFGSGWLWLAQKDSGTEKDGGLSLMATLGAETPFSKGLRPVLTCDLWEHAYYIDYRNDRAKYMAGFWRHINWAFVEKMAMAEYSIRGTLHQVT